MYLYLYLDVPLVLVNKKKTHKHKIMPFLHESELSSRYVKEQVALNTANAIEQGIYYKSILNNKFLFI